jgi:Cu2+-containing amine oxidase
MDAKPRVNRRVVSAWPAMCLLALSLSAAPVQYPLDPLSFEEYWTVLEVLRDAGHLNEETRFPIISLKEPPKELVWAWREEKGFPREAVAIVRQGPKTHEVVIDLRQGKELSLERNQRHLSECRL